MAGLLDDDPADGLLLGGEDFSVTAGIDALVATPPPPPPPPAPPDLNEVYRPYEDPALRGYSALAPPGASGALAETGTGAATAAAAPEAAEVAAALEPGETASTDFLFGDVPQPAPGGAVADLLAVLAARPAAPPAAALVDVGLDEPLGRAPATGPVAGPAAASAGALAGGRGLLADLPPGVPGAELERPPVVVDLSGGAAAGRPTAGGAAGGAAADQRQAPGPPLRAGAPPRTGPSARAPAPPAAAGGAGAGRGPAGALPQPRPIPTDARGFGSDDLFGPARQERSLQESFQDEAVAAYGTVVKLLPDSMQQQIPSCMAPPSADEETDLVLPDPGAGSRQAPGAGAGAAGASARSRGLGMGGGALEEEATATALGRSCEGRWVPTYMRRQLAENGHTTFPSAANAHEYDASAPPPTLGQAFAETGTEFGETAQNVLNFILAVLSSLSVQCQMCSHQAASAAHEQVVVFGEGLCGGGAAGEEPSEVVFGRPLDEVAAGLGPVRSRVQRTLPGVTFAQLTAIVRTKLITARLPEAEPLQRLVRARTLERQAATPDNAVEDWLFSSELVHEALPDGVLQHICPAPENPVERRKALACRESWHVDFREETAEVEISTSPTRAPVTIVLRLAVTGSGAAGRCEVDGRLFARPRQRGAVLPLGLVEQLMELHHRYAESLRDSVLALTPAVAQEQAAPTRITAGATAGAAVEASSAPEAGAAVKRQQDTIMPEGTPASQATPPGRTTKVAHRPPAEVSSVDPQKQQAVRAAPPTWTNHQGPPVLKEKVAREGTGGPVENSLLLMVADGI